MIRVLKKSIAVSLMIMFMVGSMQTVSAAPVPAGDSNQVSVPPFPYVAQITADNVNVRSGPGTNYYGCGKLKKNDKVTVVGSYFSWSQIVPPPGSFSWISKRYVKVSPDNDKIGIVDGDAVRVYVGAEDRDPIRSTRTQFKLGSGDTVQLLGELRSDYYKIAPPTGAYRWVSTKYTQPVISKVVVPPPPPPVRVPVVPEANTPIIPAPSPPVRVPVTPEANTPVVPPDEPALLEKFQMLKERIDAERAKPIKEQNYDEIKKELLALAAEEQTGKAARYAKHALKIVERYQLAFDVTRADELGDRQLAKIRETIDQARQARLAEVKKVGKFAAVGTFEVSNIYGSSSQTKYYRIIGEDKRIVCYAAPDVPMDHSSFVGKKVGLVGEIEPHPQTVGALVRFTQIVLLD